MDSEIGELIGSCGCGAMTIRAKVPKTYGVCHCRMCRRWTGGVWMGVATSEPPKIEGPLKIWKSSIYAERAICEQCGSSIWHRPKGMKNPILGQGLFDDQEGWVMNRQIFSDEQPEHYAFGERGSSMTGWGAIVAILFGKMPK